MNRRHIAAAFAQGEPGHGASALTSLGREARSYREPIAVWEGEPEVSTCLVSDAVRPKRFSMTTSHHIGAIRAALAIAGKHQREVPHDEIRSLSRSLSTGY